MKTFAALSLLAGLAAAAPFANSSAPLVCADGTDGSNIDVSFEVYKLTAWGEVSPTHNQSWSQDETWSCWTDIVVEPFRHW